MGSACEGSSGKRAAETERGGVEGRSIVSADKPLKRGDRVFIHDPKHPWSGHAGVLIAFEEFGPGQGLKWTGWRIELDGNCGQAYAAPEQLMGPGRVDSIRMTGRRARR
jgi:hypothetical protein